MKYCKNCGHNLGPSCQCAIQGIRLEEEEEEMSIVTCPSAQLKKIYEIYDFEKIGSFMVLLQSFRIK